MKKISSSFVGRFNNTYIYKIESNAKLKLKLQIATLDLITCDS